MFQFVNKRYILLFIFKLFHCQIALSQNIPSIICPNYFQYFTEGGRFIGRITLPNVTPGLTRLDVHLAQRSGIQNNNYGKVSLYESYNTTLARIENSMPIYYRVTFPSQYEVPKVTLIAVNGKEICRDNPYPPPSTNIALDHQITASLNTPAYNPTLNNNPGNRNIVASPLRIQTPLSAQQYTFSNPGPIRVLKPSNQPTQAAVVRSNLNFDCGREGTSPTLTPFIYGGHEIRRGQFPWLTAIYLKRAEGVLYICGGSLVSPRTVVTAAHCFEKTGLKANQVLVVLGHHDLNNFSEEGDVKVELQSLLMHPEYNPAHRSDADVAILHLKASVRLSALIQPVCLWHESDDVNLIRGQKASVAGWGEDENQHNVSPIPKVVESDIVSDSECQEALRSSSQPKSFPVRTICVSNENGDGPCRGDSGSGLIMKRSGRWTLRGVVSSGLTRGKRCFLSEFVYFCDLAKHINWLRSNVI